MWNPINKEVADISQFVHFTTLNGRVADAMKQCEFKELADHIVEFLSMKQEKYTYNTFSGKYYISSFFPTIPGSAWNRMVAGVHEITAYEKRIPLQADIVVTGKCHCHCWHCFRSKYAGADLSYDTISQCMNALYKLGTATVGITGGEPMLRPDILDIIKLIPEGMEGQLYTTGYKIDSEFALKLKDTKLTRCIISLDHYDEETACALRHNPNAFQDALQAIRALTEQNIYTAVTVCITEELLKPGDLQKYFDFVQTLGVQEIRVIMQIPQGKLEGKSVGRIYGEAIGLVKQIKKEYGENESFPVIVNFCEFENADYIGCGAGSNYISINNNGLVTPCVAVPLSFGNIYEESLEDIYKHMEDSFPKSDRVCYGIASGRIVSREKIDTTITPLPVEVSQRVAKQCKASTKRGAFFEYCANGANLEKDTF